VLLFMLKNVAAEKGDKIKIDGINENRRFGKENSNELLTFLESQIERLPERQRGIIKLSRYEGLTFTFLSNCNSLKLFYNFCHGNYPFNTI
jgi:DNA-directed RNA polymerase specialized sigma24 family protein